MKKIIAMILAALMVLAMVACAAPAAEAPAAEAPAAEAPKAEEPAKEEAKAEEPAAPAYPTANINGIVQWGAGGGTDSLMRPLAALAEKELGYSIVIQNMTGATGSIATQYVYDAAADGYNLLMGAENPALYKTLGISELTYEDFDCVFLIGADPVGIVVGKNSPYATFTELIEAAKAAPGTIKISTTGKGGLPWEVGAFITEVTGATFNQIPYDSDASAATAVKSGECDFTVCKVQSGLESYKSGDLKFLTMMTLEPAAAMPEVPLVGAEYEGFDKYLPWGPFYGVFVKKGTDQAIIDTLSAAFAKAAEDPSYQEVLANFNIGFLGYTGAEAAEYIAGWQSNTIAALENSGALAE